MTKDILIEEVGKFSIASWLMLIYLLEKNGIQKDFEKTLSVNEKMCLYSFALRQGFLDLIIRVSSFDEDNGVSPTVKDYIRLVGLYLMLCQKDIDLVKRFEVSMTRQLHHIQGVAVSIVNYMGRVFGLYSLMDTELKQKIGLDSKQIVAFTLLMNKIRYKETSFWLSFSIDDEEIQKFCKVYDIKRKNLFQFLNFLSLSQSKYKQLAKEKGISKKKLVYDVNCATKPIFEVNEAYIIPSIQLFANTISRNLFDIVFNLSTNQSRFRDRFGKLFENYIKDITSYFYNIDIDYDEEFFEKGKKKPEFMIQVEDTYIIVEAKVLHIEAQKLYSEDEEAVYKTIKNTLPTAFKQIDEAYTSIQNQKVYGIIIAHSNFETWMLFKWVLEEQNKKKYNENIVVMSIDEYEQLISSDSGKIIKHIENKISGYKKKNMQFSGFIELAFQSTYAENKIKVLQDEFNTLYTTDIELK
ncbi:hypothetical protein LXN10_01780 [Arcobacter sp. KX21116]|uniref:hypothetical protein n=1 Tax=Arcobacter iocasae TaxID=2906515 RepID=UPI0035D4139E